MNISGSLLKGLRPIMLNAVSPQTNANDVLQVITAYRSTTANSFAMRNPALATFVQTNPNRQTLKFDLGRMSVSIAGRRQNITKRRDQQKMHIDFLDLQITGLGEYQNVGGLLGDDDHGFAASALPRCQKLISRQTIKSDFALGSRFSAN